MFARGFSYGRSGLAGNVEDFPWEDDDLWASMTDVARTPIWAMSAFSLQGPRDPQEKARAVQRDRAGFVQFLDEFDAKGRAIMAKAAPAAYRDMEATPD